MYDSTGLPPSLAGGLHSRLSDVELGRLPRQMLPGQPINKTLNHYSCTVIIVYTAGGSRTTKARPLPGKALSLIPRTVLVAISGPPSGGNSVENSGVGVVSLYKG